MVILEDKIFKHATRLCRRHEYPAFVSGAKYFDVRKTAKSGEFNSDEISPYFKNLIESKGFGKVGEKHNNSSIGFCAEQMAANKIISRHPASISNLEIGRALRPKTMQYKNRCEICNSLF